MHRNFDRTRAMQGLLLAMMIAGTVLLCVPEATHAATVNLGLTPGVEGALGLGTTDIRITVARIIRTFMGLLGIIAVVLILYGGFLWMTAAGNEEQVDKARKVLTQSVIGLAIILSSVAITQFVLNRLLEATGAGGGAGGGGGGGGIGGSIPLSGALGNGIIESHYPGRGQTDVPRNVRVIVTFKQPMQIASFVRGYDDNGTPDDVSDDYPGGGAPTALEDANVKIFASSAGEGSALDSADVRVAFTPDRQTFVFIPPLLGSPSADTSYQVKLGSAIRTADGEAAFSGIFAGGYLWDFTVGTFIDLTPPVVESVVPFRDSTNPRNTVVQVTFNEAMDPTSLTGDLPGFTNVRIEAGGAVVPGSVAIGNRYRTIEFVTNDLCGTNSCGGNVYCLPGSSDIAAAVRAATLSDTPPMADPTRYPADGATDVSGNSLDGNGNGTAEGPGADDHAWDFRTTDEIDLVPPAVDAISPAFDEGRVAFDAPVRVRFSKLMRLLTFSSEAMPLTQAPMPPAPDEPTCYAWFGEHVDDAGASATSTQPTKSAAVLNHCLFLQETSYVPSIGSAVQDIRQNCYYPAAATPAVGGCRPGDAYCCNGTPSATACTVNPTTGAVTPGR